MKYRFPRSRKFRAIVLVNALILGLGGMGHAQPQNLKDEYTQKPVITEDKPANKHNATDETEMKKKKQSKQERDKNTENYKGAQPPQGGRLGQGPDHPR
jgi:uncharacterized protein HemX